MLFVLVDDNLCYDGNFATDKPHVSYSLAGGSGGVGAGVVRIRKPRKAKKRKRIKVEYLVAALAASERW